MINRFTVKYQKIISSPALVREHDRYRIQFFNEICDYCLK